MEAAAQSLNSFLGSRSVLGVDRRWVDQGPNSYWAFCVDYQTSAESITSPGSLKQSGRQKIDYRAVLPADQFAVFSQLRDLRKELAQQDAVPVYTIFTNEQLADMVRNSARSLADLEQIAGIGDARVAKFGERFLHVLSQPAAAAP